MVNVPRINEQRVQQAPTPQLRAQTQAPDAAFGFDTQDVSGEALKTTAIMGDIADAEVEKANQLAYISFDRKLSEKQLELQNRAQETKGKAAFGTVKTTKDEYDSYTAELMKEAQNDAQRIALQKKIQSRGQSLNRTVQGHVSREIENYEQQEYAAHQFNSKDLANSHAYDKVLLKEDTSVYRASVVDQMTDEGIYPDSQQYKAKFKGKMSSLHEDIVEKYLKDDNVDLAEDYLKKNAEEISSDAKDRIAPQLEEAVHRKSVGDAYLDIVTSTKEVPASEDTSIGALRFYEATGKSPEPKMEQISRAEQLDKAKDIEDDDVRKDVIRKLQEGWAEEDRVAKAFKDENFDKALDVINQPFNQGRHPKDVFKAEWASFDPEEQSALIAASGVNGNTVTDWDKYRAFRTFAKTNRAKLAAMSHADLTQQWTMFFGPKETGAARTVWLNTVDSVGAGADVRDIKEPEDYAEDYLVSVKFLDAEGKLESDSDSNKMKYRIFKNRFNQELLAWQTDPKKGGLPDGNQSQELARAIWDQTLKEADSSSRISFGEIAGDEIEQSVVPFARFKDGKQLSGLTASDVESTVNLLRGLPKEFRVAKPEGFDIRSGKTTASGDDKDREFTEADELYIQLIQRLHLPIQKKEHFAFKQLIRQYKKDLKALGD